MLNRIIKLSINNKLIVILFTLSIAAFGIYSILNIPIGAVPDITNNQVQVITVSPNLSTQDIEQFITYPVELEMANLPGVTEIRSVSKFGLSVVTIVFKEKLGTYLPRQLIEEKIKTAVENIPDNFGTPFMGPISTGLGEIYQYTLDVKPGYEDRYNAMDLRTMQDWVVKRQLSGIPGVVEINTWGGYLKQYEIAVNPERLRAAGITITDLFDAVNANNNVAGGAYIEKGMESYFVRAEGLLKSEDDIKKIVVRNTGGIPLLIGDIASVKTGNANRFGAITGNGHGEKVLGQIMMLKDANSNEVMQAVHERIASINKTLPEGLYINPIVDRSELIGKTTFTVAENLILGSLIVMFVVILLLGNIRSSLVITSLIPLSLLFTLSIMYIFGIDANLMSLGAIDFGIIIDGAVIIVEFIALQLTLRKAETIGLKGGKRQTLMDAITFKGAGKMMNSAIFGQIIILIVFIPILSLSGVEGKMFRPMALTFSFALIGAIIFCLTWIPVASALFLKPMSEKSGLAKLSGGIIGFLERSYRPVINWAYNHKKAVIITSAATLLITFFIFARMGGEFIPTLDEGDFVIQPVLKTGTSLTETIALTTRIESILMENFPEVEKVVSRIGAAEVPTDPMSMEESDIIVKLKPKKTWKSAGSKEELATKFKEALSRIPGLDFEFTQPIEMRFNELITGVRADVAVKIFGEDLEILNQKAMEIKSHIDNVPGAADVIVEKTTGLPQMAVKYDRSKLALYGVSVDELNRIISMGFGGEAAGNIFEGEKRFDLVLRLDKDFRQDISNLQNMSINLPSGQIILLYEVAAVEYNYGPAKISRDNTQRRVVVSINVRGRDMQSVVNDVQRILGEKVNLPPGYYITYGGQFENLQQASARLKVAVPVALLLIFLMLHFAFGTLKDAAMIFTAIPLATVGGVLLLWIRGMPFSISAGVGFIALFGIAVLNGIVLIEHLKAMKEHGVSDLKEQVIRGTTERLRPVILTASAAAFGFLPMAISTGAGAEVQRPLATVVIGGLVSSTLLTMVLLPILYALLDDVRGIRWKPFGLKRYPALALLLLGIPFFAAGQKPILTPEKAVELALENNPEVKVQQLLIQQKSALEGTAYNFDKTDITWEWDANNIAENDSPLHVASLSQAFPFPTTWTARKNMLKSETRVAENASALQRSALTREVLKTWYNLQYSEARLKRFTYLDSLYSRIDEWAAKRFEAGETNYLETLNARSKKRQIQLALQALEKEKEQLSYRLEYYLNTDLSQYEMPAETPRLNWASATPATLFRPYAESVRNLEEARLQWERSQLLPDITVGYFLGFNTAKDSRLYNGYQAGLAIPLVLHGQKARIRAQQIEKEITENRLSRLALAYDYQTKELQSRIATIEKAMLDYESNGKKLAEELLRTARIGFQEGETDYFEFIQSVENATQMEINFLNQQYDLNNLIIELTHLTLTE